MGGGGDDCSGSGTGRDDMPGTLSTADHLRQTAVRMVRSDGTEIKNSDLTAQRNEWVFTPPQPLRGWLESTVTNERDYPMVYLILNITVTVIPSALCQFRFADNMPWWAGPLHVLMIVRDPEFTVHHTASLCHWRRGFTNVRCSRSRFWRL